MPSKAVIPTFSWPMTKMTTTTTTTTASNPPVAPYPPAITSATPNLPVATTATNSCEACKMWGRPCPFLHSASPFHSPIESEWLDEHWDGRGEKEKE